MYIILDLNKQKIEREGLAKYFSQTGRLADHEGVWTLAELIHPLNTKVSYIKLTHYSMVIIHAGQQSVLTFSS